MVKLPKRGDLVNVQHDTWTDIKGVVHVKGAHHFIDQTIEHVYGSGQVRTSSGDVWNIEPLANGKFRTIAR